jgi:tight adherence protein B
MMQLLAVLSVGVGIGLLTAGLARLGREKNSALRELLESELDRPTRSPEDLSELMERAGAFAERALGHSPTAGRLRTALIQAGSPLRAGEFGAMLGAGTLITAVLVLLVTKSAIAALGAALVVVVGVLYRLHFKASRRVRKMESQLPEVLQLIAGSLDAGSSLLLGMELAGEEGEPPLSLEFARVVGEAGLGRPILEALDAMSERIGSRDIAWTVKAIRIQHQTGGKLADTLRVLADFMHARQDVRGEVRALSAEARVSGKMLIGLPIGIFALLVTTRYEYMEPLLTTAIGKMMLIATSVSLVIGHLWMKKLGKVEI